MRSTLRHSRGFTLVEILIIAPFAILLIGALIAMATQATTSSLRSYAKTRIQNDVLTALDLMEQDARISLNIRLDSTDQLDMTALATNTNPLDSGRILVDKTTCAPMTTNTDIASATTYALSYYYDNASKSLIRVGDFTGKWCGGSQAAQGNSIWQRHNTPERLIENADITLVVSDYVQVDEADRTALSAKVTLTASRVVAGETVRYTGEMYVSSLNNIDNDLMMQKVTTATCPTSRTMAVDARDNHTYYIQKLGEGANARCWMLTNLAYAGGTSNGGSNTYNDTIPTGDGTNGTLHGPDNSGSATYTLAKYYIPTNANPTVYPTQPSTSTDGGATNPQYGYLYNWCAAMGAQTSTSACANATTPAPDAAVSICPSGWRLPTGTATTGDFTLLNNAVNGGLTNTDAGLRSEWLAQRSGYWYSSGFVYQGSNAYYWSSTQYSAVNAYYLSYYSSAVNPSNNSNKTNGFAVRCVTSS